MRYLSLALFTAFVASCDVPPEPEQKQQEQPSTATPAVDTVQQSLEKTGPSFGSPIVTRPTTFEVPSACSANYSACLGVCNIYYCQPASTGLVPAFSYLCTICYSDCLEEFWACVGG